MSECNISTDAAQALQYSNTVEAGMQITALCKSERNSPAEQWWQ